MTLGSIRNTVLNMQYWDKVIILCSAKIASLYGLTKAGKFWIAAKPLVQVTFIGFVFGKVIKIEQENYLAFIMYNLLLLNFISTSLTGSITSIFEQSSVISRFNINKTLFPIVVVGTNLYIYCISIVSCGILVALLSNLPLHFNMIFAPLYFGYIVVTMFIICSTLSILYPYFKDISYIIENGIMIGMWVTPIFYPMSTMPEIMQKLSYFNPFFLLIVPFNQIMHSGILPDLKTHIAMISFFFVSLLVYFITHRKLGRDIIYYC